MKTLAFWGTICMVATVNAQVLITEVIVANGGKFSDPDPATIGIYDAQMHSYSIFDSIRTNSVQDLRLANGKIYLGSQDSLVVYDASSLQRDTLLYFHNIGKIYADADVVAAGKLFGDSTVPAYAVWDATTYNMRLFDSITHVSQITGITRLGDSLFLAHNIKGTVDQFPPYGIYKDSMGALLRVNLRSDSFETNILMDTNTAGLRDIITLNKTRIVGPATEADRVVIYDAYNNLFGTFDDTTNTARLILKTSDVIYTVGVVGGTSQLFAHQRDTDSVAVVYTFPNLSFPHSLAAVAVDTIYSKVYYTVTDYNTYGRLYIGNLGGSTASDSIDVGISPEAIAIRYRVATPITDDPATPAMVRIYPNPAVDYVLIEMPDEKVREVVVLDMEGRQMARQYRIQSRQLKLNVRHWPAGTYVARIWDVKGRVYSVSWQQ